MSVVIVDTGVANVAAVRAALARMRVATRLTRDAAEVAAAARVILPGVGSFGAGMAALDAHGLAGAVRARVLRRAPTLAICLGLQLLTEGSDEAPGVRGLGVVPGVCRRLPSAPGLPHLGWGTVRAASGARALAHGWAAFAHSFALLEAPAGFEAAFAQHGRSFVAAFARAAVLACQFHPELSGAYGRELLCAWLEDRPVRTTWRELARTETARRVIPCLDVRDGRVVKGVQFDNLRDAGDPAERAAAYAADGADEVALLDVSASPERRLAALATVRRVRAVLDVPLLVGGGVRDVQHARTLLEAGADKVSVNTAAVRDPELIESIARELGSQSTVLAVDARRGAHGWDVMTTSGREVSGREAVAWCREAAERGAGEVLLTSVDRDGTGAGADLELLRAVRSAVSVPVIASGGIGDVQQAAAALDAGADAVLAASIFHTERQRIPELKRALRARGVVVRA